MSKVAVLTDSNSGITQEEAEKIGVGVLPMPFFIDEEEFFEGVTLSRDTFYEKQKGGSDIKTSQPAPGNVMALWDKYLEEYDEIVYIPMSSGLSSSCETAILLSEDYDGKVQVVNNQRISVTQKQSVKDAVELAKKGKSAAQIKEILERTGKESSIYITVDTLKYLKKGGRITPAAAAVGTVLNLKPVLQIQGEKLDAYAKVRGWKQAKKTMLDAMERDMLHRFHNQRIYLHVAYTCTNEEAQLWKEEIEDRFPQYDVDMDPLALSIACHTGPGAMAIACTRVLEE